VLTALPARIAVRSPLYIRWRAHRASNDWFSAKNMLFYWYEARNINSSAESTDPPGRREAKCRKTG